MQALQRGGRPTTLARALAEVGRISRTIAILDYVTNPAQRRRMLVQLNRQETRHQLARDVFQSRRGHVYQAYRPGQEQQLGALGLVTNVLTLWNSDYMDHAVEHLRSEGITIADQDLEHLSLLQHQQVNLHGRYAFSPPGHLRHGPLRPLTTHRGRSRESCTPATGRPISRRSPVSRRKIRHHPGNNDRHGNEWRPVDRPFQVDSESEAMAESASRAP
ncbi:MAG: Tn3 family transposase [Acidimicrobiales bacterium]